MSNKKYIKIKGKKINKDHLFYAGVVLVVGIVLIWVNSAKTQKQISYNPVVEKEILKEKKKQEKAYFSDKEEKNQEIENLFSSEKIRKRKEEAKKQINAKKETTTKANNKKSDEAKKQTEKTKQYSYYKEKKEENNNDTYFDEYSLGTETSKTESFNKNQKNNLKSKNTYIKGYVKYSYNFQYGKEKNIIIVAKENINKNIKAGAILHGKAKIDIKDRRIYVKLYKIEYGNKAYNINAGVTELDKTQGLYARIDENKAENILKTLGNKTIEIASSFNPASNLTSGFTDQVKMKMSQVTASLNKRKEVYIKMR